jgi:hypothetical protein
VRPHSNASALIKIQELSTSPLCANGLARISFACFEPCGYLTLRTIAWSHQIVPASSLDDAAQIFRRLRALNLRQPAGDAHLDRWAMVEHVKRFSPCFSDMNELRMVITDFGTPRGKTAALIAEGKER